MTDLRTRIYSRLPGWADAGEQMSRLEKVRPPVAQAPSAVEGAASAMLAAAAAGEPIDTLEAARAALVDVEGVQVARAGLELARQRAKESRDEAVAGGPNVILAALNEELDDLIDEVRGLAPLDDLVDELTALRSGRGPDYTRLRRLLSDYSEIRGMQLTTVRSASGSNLPVERPAVLFMADVPGMAPEFPLWASWLTAGYAVERRSGALRTVAPPWPTTDSIDQDNNSRRASVHTGPGVSDGKATFLKDAARPEFLLWAVIAGVRLWVPTLTEAATAARDLEVALSRQVDDGRSEFVSPTTVDTGAPAHTGRRLGERFI